MGAFWDDLEENLKDDKFRRHYVDASLEIAAADQAANAAA